MAWEARSGLKQYQLNQKSGTRHGLNGLGSPFGFETHSAVHGRALIGEAKWPGKPVRV